MYYQKKRKKWEEQMWKKDRWEEEDESNVPLIQSQALAVGPGTNLHLPTVRLLYIFHERWVRISDGLLLQIASPWLGDYGGRKDEVQGEGQDLRRVRRMQNPSGWTTAPEQGDSWDKWERILLDFTAFFLKISLKSHLDHLWSILKSAPVVF